MLQQMAIAIMITLYMIVFSLITCTIFPLIYVAKERKKEDSHSYHAYTYMIAFTCFFTNNMYYFPTYTVYICM